ncbi:MAG: hypothetical protein WCF85_09230 [Rhodospirillaceae bacterium]
MTLRSSLGRVQPRQPLDADELATMRRAAWRQQGMLAVSADDPRLTWPERELVSQLGNKLYGARKEARHG